MSKKSFFKLFCGLLALMVVLTACGGNSTNSGNTPANTGSNNNGAQTEGNTEDSTAKPVTISIAYATGDPATKQAIETTIDAFTAANSHITIKNISETTGDSYLDWLKTKEAVGEFPDLVEMRDTKIFADAGKLGVLPEKLHSLFTFLPDYDGQYYNAPLTGNNPNGIIYSKKAYADAGVTELPKTYDEFIEVQEKLLASGISPIVVGGKDLFHMGFWVNYFLISNVYNVDSDWNSKRTAQTASFTDANPSQAITDYKELFTKYVDAGWLSTGDNQTASMLVTGKAAQLYSGPWMFGQISEADPSFEFGFYAIPSRDGSVIVNGLPTLAGWSLSADASKDPAKVAAITSFIEFFFDAAQYSPYLATVNGIPTTVAEVSYETGEQMQEVLRLMSDSNVEKSMMINQWYGENAIPPQFRNWFYKLLQEIVVTDGDVTEYMKQADVEYDSNIKANLQ